MRAHIGRFRTDAQDGVIGADMKNLGTIERELRIALGGALAIWPLVLFLGGSNGLIWQLLDVALIALGVDFVVTGIRGYCPLYKRLGWSTARLEAHS